MWHIDFFYKMIFLKILNKHLKKMKKVIFLREKIFTFLKKSETNGSIYSYRSLVISDGIHFFIDGTEMSPFPASPMLIVLLHGISFQL